MANNILEDNIYSYVTQFVVLYLLNPLTKQSTSAGPPAQVIKERHKKGVYVTKMCVPLEYQEIRPAAV